MVKTADAVIIGGGIMGVSAAYFLTTHGFGRILLLEKDSLASGSTGFSTAHVRQHYVNELPMRLAGRTLDLFDRWEEEFEGRVGFRRIGYMVPTNEEGLPAVREILALQKRVGVESRELSPEEDSELAPGHVTETTVAAAFEPRAGYADPHGTTATLAEAARRGGAEIRQQTSVRAILVEGDKVRGVKTDREEIHAPVVLNAAGPWAGRMGETAGVKYDLRLHREPIGTFTRPEAVPPFPITRDIENQSYFRPEGADNVVVGLGTPAEIVSVDPDGYNRQADPEAVVEMSNRLQKRVPAMAESGFVRGWAGIFTITEDWHPIAGPLPGLDGYYGLVGGSGHGFKLGPPLGEAVAAMIAGRTPPIDVSEMGHERFSGTSTIAQTTHTRGHP